MGQGCKKQGIDATLHADGFSGLAPRPLPCRCIALGLGGGATRTFLPGQQHSAGGGAAGGWPGGGHMAQGICGLLERWAEPAAAGGGGAAAGGNHPGGEWRPGLVGFVQLVAVLLGILGLAGLSEHPGSAAALQWLAGGRDGSRSDHRAGANGPGLAGAMGHGGGSGHLARGRRWQSRWPPLRTV